jgi:Uma2 family endonuclease
MTTQAVAVPVFVNKNKQSPRRPLLPYSFYDRIELASELRIPATYEEYIEYVHDCEYRVQYHDGHIVSFIEYDEKTDTVMGEATPIHERLTARMITLLSNLLDFRNEGTRYAIYGSNIKIYIPKGNQSYNPDVAVAIEPAQYIKHRPKKRLITSLVNPHIIVEVMSKGTQKFDKTEKLPIYKSLDSVQQIIYIEALEVGITSHIRISDTEWQTITLKKATDELPIVGEKAIALKEVYGYFHEFQIY